MRWFFVWRTTFDLATGQKLASEIIDAVCAEKCVTAVHVAKDRNGTKQNQFLNLRPAANETEIAEARRRHVERDMEIQRLVAVCGLLR